MAKSLLRTHHLHRRVHAGFDVTREEPCRSITPLSARPPAIRSIWRAATKNPIRSNWGSPPRIVQRVRWPDI
jgi:hypothetical protein